MNREPIYHKDLGRSGHLRVISCPNGQWVAQELIGSRDSFGIVGTMGRDPWTNLHSPTTQEAALAYMYQTLPGRQG
jgi:hypothetical protein